MYQKGNMAVGGAVPEGELADCVMNIRLATGDHAHSVVENGALTFDKDYEQWVNEHQKLINDLRTASNSPVDKDNDDDLHNVVEGVRAHYDELFRLKSKGTKADVFHMFFGMWKTPAERCFMWLGGFRPSELLKILRKQLEPFAGQQLMELYNLQQSSMMGEEALSQGMDALQGILSEILSSSSTSLGSTSSANSAKYDIMELARSKLLNLQDFLPVADNLRQQTLRQLQRILTTRQAARAFLLINDYISQLRNNLCRLAHQNQVAKRKCRSEEKGTLIAIEYPEDHCRSVVRNGALAFDKDYEHWLDEHQRVINNLRTAFNSQMGDNDELHTTIVAVTSHYDELFRLKNIGTKADVFHMLSGAWKTPLERCFMWLAGFRSSDLLKIVRDQLEPLTEDQLIGLYNLQQSSFQAEDALSQAMGMLHQNLSETLSSSAASLGPTGCGNVAQHMDQMALGMKNLDSLEAILHQADILRQQILNQQLPRILTMRQVARAFLVINDYISRIRNVKCGSCPVIDSKL
ncbi:transcription factor TGA2.3-like [Neltuma alba]|uniref:transcription factor TGA2.3-like n=1 Tax=Neltuma alba TaxID=207710 RepID=UPI0010A32545|nr:transcription factor TGA2.3-like [Prosopis alba]